MKNKINILLCLILPACVVLLVVACLINQLNYKNAQLNEMRELSNELVIESNKLRVSCTTTAHFLDNCEAMLQECVNQ